MYHTTVSRKSVYACTGKGEHVLCGDVSCNNGWGLACWLNLGFLSNHKALHLSDKEETISHIEHFKVFESQVTETNTTRRTVCKPRHIHENTQNHNWTFLLCRSFFDYSNAKMRWQHHQFFLSALKFFKNKGRPTDN